jgi:hypothetical protein
MLDSVDDVFNLIFDFVWHDKCSDTWWVEVLIV